MCDATAPVWDIIENTPVAIAHVSLETDPKTLNIKLNFKTHALSCQNTPKEAEMVQML